MGKRKIRNFLINKNLQARLILEIVLPAFLLSILSGVLVFAIIWPLATNVASAGTISFMQTLAIIGLCLASIGMICLIAAWAIVVTHRIAGPIYHIEQDLKRVLQGEHIEPIHIRRGDEFHELVNLLNQLIDRASKQNATRDE